MISFIIKFTLSFTISFSILCLPFNGKPLFATFYKYFGHQVLQTVNQLVKQSEKKIIPQFVKLVKSDPLTHSSLPKHYHQNYYFSKNKFTTEEKHLMMKAMLENEKPEL